MRIEGTRFVVVVVIGVIKGSIELRVGVWVGAGVWDRCISGRHGRGGGGQQPAAGAILVTPRQHCHCQNNANTRDTSSHHWKSLLCRCLSRHHLLALSLTRGLDVWIAPNYFLWSNTHRQPDRSTKPANGSSNVSEINPSHNTRTTGANSSRFVRLPDHSGYPFTALHAGLHHPLKHFQYLDSGLATPCTENERLRVRWLGLGWLGSGMRLMSGRRHVSRCRCPWCKGLLIRCRRKLE